MKAWEALTEAGQIRRLRPLAANALTQYPIGAEQIRLVGGFTNVIFRIDTSDGPYALRIDLHQDHSDEDVEIEIAWLQALAADTEIDVARPVPAIDGRPFVFADAAGVPGARRCALFEWIPGRPLADTADPEGYFQLGRMSAQLHEHGAGFTPPHQPLTWDRIFYWPEEVDPVVIFKPEMQHHFRQGRRQVLDRCISLVERAFRRLDPAGAQMTHGDLHPWNVHRYRSRLIAFDFEDVTWGHRVQDIATTLFYERNHPDYPQLRQAFADGYRSITSWPVTYEGELEHFMAARSLMFVNYVANLHDDPSDFYGRVFPRLEAFLEAWER